MLPAPCARSPRSAPPDSRMNTLRSLRNALRYRWNSSAGRARELALVTASLSVP